jgi:outer membrane protein assembly factor BamB
MPLRRLILAAAALAWCAPLVWTGPLAADDWPQFRGAHRDGRSDETGLLQNWPEGGPELLWSVTGLGKGFTQVAVAGGRIYSTGLVGKDGMLRAYDPNGQLLWEKSYGPEWTGGNPGARSIPTVCDGLVYVAGGTGHVACFDAASGELKWSQDMFQRYQAPQIKWGWAESLLVDGNNLILTPCGKAGTMVAVDRKTGAPVWASKDLGEKSGFCSPILIEIPVAAGSALNAATTSAPGAIPGAIRGAIPGAALNAAPSSAPGAAPEGAASGGPPARRLIVTLTDTSVIAVDPAGGQIVWRHPYKNSNGNHPITPIYHDGLLYVTSGYGKGAVGLRLAPDGNSVKQIWEQPKQDTLHGNVVLEGGCVFGSSHQNSPGWVCVELATGALAWEDRCVGKGGSVSYADGMLYCYAEDGTLGLVKPSGKACEVVSRFKITQGTGEHWAHPTISGGRLYIRHGDALMCYDIRRDRQ